MGLLYNLEVNDLAVCLECDMMIDGGETGCIQKMNEIVGRFREKQENVLADHLEQVYQTQHREFFSLTDEEVIQNIAAFLQEERETKNIVKLNEEQMAAFLEDVFFYPRNLITSVTIGMFEGVSIETATNMLSQWKKDICTSYFEYKESLLALLLKGEK